MFALTVKLLFNYLFRKINVYKLNHSLVGLSVSCSVIQFTVEIFQLDLLDLQILLQSDASCFFGSSAVFVAGRKDRSNSARLQSCATHSALIKHSAIVFMWQKQRVHVPILQLCCQSFTVDSIQVQRLNVNRDAYKSH